MPLPAPPLRFHVPQMPHIRYEKRTEPTGQVWLHFSCNGCSDHTRKPCSNVQRATYWLQIYAGLHQHVR
jgi:hypothetical protein